MINKKYAYLLVFAPFLTTISPKITHQQVVATTKELVQGRQFTHTYRMADGVAQEQWAIDGTVVDKTTYEDTILAAEMAERRAERERAYLAQVEELAAFQRAQQGAVKKLIGKTAQAVRQQLAKLEEYHLLPYITYGQQSLTQEQFESVGGLLTQATELRAAAEPALSELQAMLAKLEQVEQGMKRLIRDSIEQAIAQSDDTEMLKKLLA